jgi:nicotinamide riboside transporter PnuC
MWQTISLIAAGISVIGAIVNANKRIEGFYIWLTGNALWITHGLYTKDYGEILMFSIYTLISLWGIYTWRKKQWLK